MSHALIPPPPLAARLIFEITQAEVAALSETVWQQLGRLGELGQPIIRRKARNTLEEFAQNLSVLLASTPK